MVDYSQTELENEDTQHGRFLAFTLGNECYGLEIRYVTEIIGMQEISGIPEAPAYIKGIINLRGMIIPVIDVRLKFKKPEAEYTDRTCIIVVDTGEVSVGLIVDEVYEVLTIDDGDIAPPPDIRIGVKSKYLAGIGKSEGRVILLLDSKNLFFSDEVAMMTEICEKQ